MVASQNIKKAVFDIKKFVKTKTALAATIFSMPAQCILDRTLFTPVRFQSF
jgi:hypothetical protein